MTHRLLHTYIHTYIHKLTPSLLFLLSVFTFASLLSALGGRDVSGATFCVTNPTELQDALTAAQNNGQDDTIQVVQGTYTGNFTYTASLTEDFKLTMQGGYTSGCSSRVVDPANTILDGGRPLTISYDIGNTGASFTIDGFTIRNGNDWGIKVDLLAAITLTNNTISGNCNCHSPGGGGVWVSGGVITLTNNTISGNSSVWFGGGVSARSSSAITLTNNTISGNNVRYEGGGVYIEGGSTVILTGNTISGNTAHNSAGGGGYAYVYGSTSTICFTNNTVASNNTATNGGGLYIALGNDSATASVYNNIIDGNTASAGLGGDIFNNADADGNGTASVVNICYNDFTDLAGNPPVNTGSGCNSAVNNGNIVTDPLFVDSGTGNFRLQSGSPCRDVGYNSAPCIPSNDRDGNPRIINSVVDMGAYEYGGTPKICRTCPRAFSVRQGRTLCKSFSVRSCVRGMRLNWTVSEGCDWLTLSPTSGTSTGERDGVRACVNTAGMAKGDYKECTVTIIGNAINSPQTCVIRLRVK